MRIFRKGNVPDTGLRAKGSHLTAETKHGPVVRKWHAPAPFDMTPYRLYVETEWAYATSWASDPEPMAYQTAVHLSEGTELLPRDILVMAMYGSLYEFTMPDGTVAPRFRDIAQNPQLILDLITDLNGSVIWRAPIGWVGLAPGNSGQVLAIINGTPTWQDVYPVWLDEVAFLLEHADVRLPGARRLSSSATNFVDYSMPGHALVRRAALEGDVTADLGSNIVTINPQAVTLPKIVNATSAARLLARASTGPGSFEEATISQVLDFVGTPARGDILVRGLTSWQRLPAGTLNFVLTAQGPGLLPVWAPPPGYVTPPVDPPPDPGISHTKLLLGFPGTNLSTVIADESPSAHGLATVVGAAAVSTTQSKFGGSSLVLHGTGDKLQFGDNADWHLGSDIWSVELEAWFTDTTTSQYFIGQWNVGASQLSWIAFFYQGEIYFTDSLGGSDTLNHIVSSGFAPVANEWIHMAWSFDGTKYRVFKNGVMKGSSTTIRSIYVSGLPLTIGDLASPSSGFKGWFDEIRLKRGECPYNSDAGFPRPTAPHPRA